LSRKRKLHAVNEPRLIDLRSVVAGKLRQILKNFKTSVSFCWILVRRISDV